MSAKEAMRRFKFCLDLQEGVFHGKSDEFFAMGFVLEMLIPDSRH